jgi:hypothetical protein
MRCSAERQDGLLTSNAKKVAGSLVSLLPSRIHTTILARYDDQVHEAMIDLNTMKRTTEAQRCGGDHGRPKATGN